ncbi:Gmad2 immunoglobulin-like domain-containing protein [Georgenia sp. H159]|uniref:Gmad2 immunoglobulin-like domain-containing protein n=1 Tax=Georgenia sp. H159 TaxID=3076115 RepID=UPI002D772025|nr:Gmad2 immunoglobulin-like domain-containing protein [Georgenia sp. H159]
MTIDVQQPRPNDIVGDEVQIAGMAGGGFEATYLYRISEGHDEVTGHFMAGDGVGGHGQFQVSVDVSGAAFTRERLQVEVFHESPKDGSEQEKVIVPVILGSQIVPGYTTYLEYEVQAGDTLWGIAQQHYGDGSLYHRLVTANPDITDPDVIHTGDIVRVPQGS